MRILLLLIWWASSCSIFAQDNSVELSIWANEAIVSTYTYNYQNYLSEQKKIARYFTPHAWIIYTEALTNSKLIESIEKNKYSVTAVALSPPAVKSLGPNIWQASMPTLVAYKNNQHEQKQRLLITLTFKKVSKDAGVRGFAIESFQAVPQTTPCKCDV
jgi:hypothetical protein